MAKIRKGWVVDGWGDGVVLVKYEQTPFKRCRIVEPAGEAGRIVDEVHSTKLKAIAVLHHELSLKVSEAHAAWRWADRKFKDFKGLQQEGELERALKAHGKT